MKVARLFDEIVPRRYTLDLIVRMEKAETMGREVVYFDLAAPTRTLVFHAAGLTILSGRLDGTTESAGIVVHPQDLTVAFTFETILPKGSHELDIQFKGSISNSMHGLYRSDYLDGSRKKWLATTQFEAVHAREAFVCIDEPAAKAVFEVSLTVPEAMAALSNANVSHEETSSEGYKKVQFAPTPVMSTYLLAFLVGEFEYVEDTASDGTLVRVYATPGKTSQLGFALDTTIRILPYFNDYFDTHYPLPKLDLIAVPDFSAGAMENWGAITFRETALLLDPDKTSLANKQRVAEVIAHELAHQWFGDLVTMSWWGDLWLNEGFASWIETLAIDEIWPEWHIWSMFLDSDVSRAQRLDSLENTHPIQVEVDDPRALDEIFDAISYSKGASILNMLHHYLGADVFRQGLRTYLRAHQFANATTEDLWRALEHASGKPVVAVMSAWTSHPGFPLLSLSDGHVSQRRFYRSRKTPDLAKKTAPEVWPVPFSVITDSQTETASALIKSSRSVLPDKLADSAWVKPNPGQTAFYRMHYTHDMIERLTEPLQKQTLGDRDRYGVVSDVFATTEAGITPTADALRLLETLRDEPDFVVWSGMRSGLVNIMAIVEQETLLGDLEAFGRWLVEPHVTRLGWERRPGEAAFDTLMRPMILQLAVRFDSPQVTTE
ncbi:MAG TPA: M1 family metallopeptidase, partial [Candidatus Saccharimonadia bacterium]|nr:M1 family metallopeptidase [Candidatus Saccharimonadia bacterium]